MSIKGFDNGNYKDLVGQICHI